VLAVEVADGGARHAVAVKPPADPLIRGPIDDPGRPVVLYVHGGGWFFTGASWVRHPSVARWARARVAVWSTDYRPRARSLADVERAYRAVRRRVGPKRRVCIHGESSGAQLALMVAARHPSVDCVIAGSGVVDLAAVPATSSLRTMIDRELLPHGGMRRWDPLTNAARIRQPVLLIHHRDDPVVAAAQSRHLASTLSHATLIELPRAASGPRSYHGPRTTANAKARAWRAARRLVVADP
jgi:dipeptidyl aminopeptidase/acylaminoacyl peptidase